MPEKEEAMKCKHCKAELKAGAKICPSCGESVKQTMNKVEKQPKLKTWHWAVIITVSVIAVLVGAIAIWWAAADVESFSEGITLINNAFNEPDNDVFYKKSYTVSDKKAEKWRDKVVATVGGKELTNGQLQIFYWQNVRDFLNNYGYYAVYAGLDYTKPLDEQTCPEVDGTWQHFFLDDALSGWHNYQAMAILAEKAGMELDDALQNDIDNMRNTLTQSAIQGGYASIDAMLKSDMGAGCTYEDYQSYMQIYYMGYMYFEKMYAEAEGKITDEMIQSWFDENQSSLAESKITKDSGDYYDVRHLLILVEGGTKDDKGNTVYTDAQWEACRQEAQKIYDEWLAGDRTEATFAALANKHSEDNGSNTNGGLYDNLTADLKDTANLDENFVAWYTDDDRKAGDHALIKTQYGYHVMYFVDAQPQWESASREGIMKEKSAEIVNNAIKQFPISVEYKKIVLGTVNLDKSK